MAVAYEGADEEVRKMGEVSDRIIGCASLDDGI